MRPPSGLSRIFKRRIILPMLAVTLVLLVIVGVTVFNGITINYQANNFMRSASVLSSIPALLKAFDSGDLKTYYDVIQMSK